MSSYVQSVTLLLLPLPEEHPRPGQQAGQSQFLRIISREQDIYFLTLTVGQVFIA